MRVIGKRCRLSPVHARWDAGGEQPVADLVPVGHRTRV